MSDAPQRDAQWSKYNNLPILIAEMESLLSLPNMFPETRSLIEQAIEAQKKFPPVAKSQQSNLNDPTTLASGLL